MNRLIQKNQNLEKKIKTIEEQSRKKTVLKENEKIDPFSIEYLNGIAHQIPNNRNSLLFIFSTGLTKISTIATHNNSNT